MLFSAKLKGFFVDQSDQATLLARTSSPTAPLVVEEVQECATDDPAALEEAIKTLQPKKPPSGYMQAVCGVYPSKRLVRRASLELKRIKDPTYFPEILNQQFRIEADKYTTVVLNANDGSDFDPGRAAPQKEVLFGGIPADDIVQVQDKLLDQGLYPERLELGSISVLGGLVDYLAFTDEKNPTLVLEVGPEITHSYIVTGAGVEATRPIPQGYESMVPVVQKELGLKDEESARKLFFSNTFDFTGMGAALTRKLMKELQSSIGFYEVQTGQSVGLLHTLLLPPKLVWLEGAIASALGVAALKLDLPPWLNARGITLAENVQKAIDGRWMGLFSLMINHNAPTTTPDALAEKKREAAGPQVPSWHPNFRNYEQLPDTKVVRTAFFINGGAVLVALVMLIYFGLGELQLHNVRSQTREWGQQIERDRPSSDRAVADFHKFQAVAARIDEVDAFVHSRPQLSTLIVNLGRTRPTNVALDAFDLRGDTLTLRGTVRGAPDKASGYASAYVEMLRKAPEFSDVFEEVNLTNLSRVPTTGRLAIEVVIKLNVPSAKEGKK